MNEIVLQEPEKKLLTAICWCCGGCNVAPVKALCDGPATYERVREAHLSLDDIHHQFQRDIDSVAKTVFGLVLNCRLDAAEPVARGLVAYLQSLQATGTMLEQAMLFLTDQMTAAKLKPTLLHEKVKCSACGVECQAAHPSCESLECPRCGHRNAPPSSGASQSEPSDTSEEREETMP